MTDIESPDTLATQIVDHVDFCADSPLNPSREIAALIRARDLAIRADERARVEAEGWIAVEERLPEPLEVVLIYPFNVDGPLVGYRHSGNWWDSNDEYEPKPIFHVTHWRALPAPPTDATQQPSRAEQGET